MDMKIELSDGMYVVLPRDAARLSGRMPQEV
jgi:hypothetical protein